MKKLLLFTLILLFMKAACAQLAKNSWLLGGNLTYIRYDQGSDAILTKGGTLDATLNSGYFLIDKLAGGTRINLLLGKSKYTRVDGSTNVSKQTTIGFGPFLRYYFLPNRK